MTKCWAAGVRSLARSRRWGARSTSRSWARGSRPAILTAREQADQKASRRAAGTQPAGVQAARRQGVLSVRSARQPLPPDTVPLLEVVKLIEGVIERLQPQSICTHHGGDLNIDHVTRPSRDAHRHPRPCLGSPVKDVYAYEVPSLTEWAFGQFTPFRPNVFVEILATCLELR